MKELDHDKLRQLAAELKTVCDNKGKEKKNDLSRSSLVFHQLATEYKKLSPDKFSLIKSVGLLNAAITRKPANVFQIENDLSQLCRHILQQANAHKQSADLVKQAKTVKSLITQMRSDANQAIANLKSQQQKEKKSPLIQKMLKKMMPNFVHTKKSFQREKMKIKALQSIQLGITKQYKSIMKNLSQYCVSVMGKPPCRFAVVGMGSIARNEITPYSDFEHIILLEDQEDYEKNLDYFRWFSVIFHVVVLNLQETIVPNLNIAHLNTEQSKFGNWFFDAYTTNGVSFDGMMVYACKFPIGRQQPTHDKPWKTELIKPVSLMLQYLSSEENIKNGYHLSDILTETCHVFGDEALRQQFEDGILAYQANQTHAEKIAGIAEQVKKDLDKFSTRFSLASMKSKEVINVKQLCYRSVTLFISAMGKIYDIKESSCFEIVIKLANHNKISKKTKHLLLYAVAIACEVRLNMYMENKSQYDYLHALDEDTLDDFLKMVGQNCIIKFFQITYCLQCELVKILSLRNSYLYSKPKFMNITICYALRLDFYLHSLLSQSSRDISTLSEQNNNFFNFDQCFELLETQLTNLKSSGSGPDTNYFLQNIMEIAVDLHKMAHYDEALEFYKRLLEAICRMYPYAMEATEHIPSVNGPCFQETEDGQLMSDGMSIVLDEPILDPMEPLAHISLTHLLIADCLVEMCEFDEALFYTNRLSEILETNSSVLTSFVNELDVWEFYNALGNTMLKLKQYDRSLKYLEVYFKFYQPTLSSLKEQHVSDKMMHLYGGIGTCLLYLHEHQQSLKMFQNAIELIKENESDENFLFKPAMKASTIYLNIGKCLIHLCQYDDALEHLYKGLQLITASSLCQRNSIEESQLLREIGICHWGINCFEDSLSYFEGSLQIRANLATDKDKETAEAINELVACLHMHSNIQG